MQHKPSIQPPQGMPLCSQDYLHSRIAAYENGDLVNKGDDHKLLVDLLRYHPNAAAKIGSACMHGPNVD